MSFRSCKVGSTPTLASEPFCRRSNRATPIRTSSLKPRLELGALRLKIRHVSYVQSWDIEVELPQDEKLAADLAYEISNEGLDWGDPDFEKSITCEDEVEIVDCEE
jgi:hypothetical protein